MRRIFNQAIALAISRTAKDTYILSVGNGLAATLAIAFTVLAARVLEPERFGIVAAAISFIIIVEAIGDLGLGSSLFRFVSSELAGGRGQKAESILKVVFLLRTATAIFVLVVLAIFSTLLSKLVFGQNQPLLVVLSALAVFGYLLLDFQITAFQARHKWLLSAFFTVFTNLFRLTLLLLLIWFGQVSVGNVLTIFAASPIFSFLLSLFWQRASLAVEDNWQNVATKIAPFSGWLGVNRVASALSGRVDVLLLLAISGAYSAGIYSAAKQLIIGVPLVIGSIATVLAPRFAATNDVQLSVFFKKTVWLSILLSAGLVIGIVTTPLIIQLFGSAYQESVGVLQLLFLGYIPFVISMPAVNVLIYSFGKTGAIALIALLQLPLVYFGSLALIPSLGVVAPALMIGLSNLLTAAATYAFSWYYLLKKR